MTKHFSEIDSEGPNLANFQLSFWRLAVEKFEEIQDHWQDCAVEEGEENSEYTAADFEVDAAVALVLAGTSVAELIGQNVPAHGDKTPHLRPAFKQLVADPIPSPVESFIEIYDALRHFGMAKHQIISDISESQFCEHMATAQGIWTAVLMKTRGSFGEDFTHTFTLE